MVDPVHLIESERAALSLHSSDGLDTSSLLGQAEGFAGRGAPHDRYLVGRAEKAILQDKASSVVSLSVLDAYAFARDTLPDSEIARVDAELKNDPKLQGRLDLLLERYESDARCKGMHGDYD